MGVPRGIDKVKKNDLLRFKVLISKCWYLESMTNHLFRKWQNCYLSLCQLFSHTVKWVFFGRGYFSEFSEFSKKIRKLPPSEIVPKNFQTIGFTEQQPCTRTLSCSDSMICFPWRNDSAILQTHQLRKLGAITENLCVSVSAEFTFIRIGKNSTSANSEN